MKRLLLFSLVLLLGGCATRSPETNALQKDHQGLSKSYIKNVPFEDQEEYYCGPAALSMVLRYKGHAVSRRELNAKLVTQNSRGTYQTNLVSEVRYQGLLALPLYGLKNLLSEIEHGNPVIVLQNLGLTIAPVWHYAVVTGFNLERSRPTIRLHTGHEKDATLPMKLFEETWALADSWGLVILNPGEISETQEEITHVGAAAGLEQVHKLTEAKIAYEAILERWPESLSALIGMGNVGFEKKKYEEARISLERATKIHPTSAVAWHNLATLEGFLGETNKAKFSAKKALNLADKDQAIPFQKSLARWLSKN